MSETPIFGSYSPVDPFRVFGLLYLPGTLDVVYKYQINSYGREEYTQGSDYTEGKRSGNN